MSEREREFWEVVSMAAIFAAVIAAMIITVLCM
jgi:hypothetical protein